jgi:hypothetical protein
MSTAATLTPNRLDVLPPPAAVHRRLGEALREVVLLRRQLRLSAQAEAELRRRTEEGHRDE